MRQSIEPCECTTGRCVACKFSETHCTCPDYVRQIVIDDDAEDEPAPDLMNG